MTFDKVWSENCIVSIIVLRPYALLASLIILVTLRILITLAIAGANDIIFKIAEFILFKIISNIAQATTKISNLFQPFL